MLCYPGRPLTTSYMGNVDVPAPGGGGVHVDPHNAPHTTVQEYIPPIQVGLRSVCGGAGQSVEGAAQRDPWARAFMHSTAACVHGMLA